MNGGGICFLQNIPYIIRKTEVRTGHSTDMRGWEQLLIHLEGTATASLQPHHSILFMLQSIISYFHIFTVSSMLGSLRQLVLCTMGTFLRHGPTHLHILNKCTCARICTIENQYGCHSKHNMSLSLHDPI